MYPKSCAAGVEQGIAPLADGCVYFPVPEAWNPEMKASGNHPYDGVVPAIQSEAFPQDVGSSVKLPLPEALAHERQRRGADLVFVRREGAAHQRIHAQQWKEVRGNEFSVDLLGFASPRQAERIRSRNGHGAEGAIVFLPVAKVRIRNGAPIKIRLALAEGDQLVGLRKRQRVE